MTTDERLAALEAKMDALTAPPSDYYTSRYSGEEIDAAIAAVPGKAETAQLCNRNLLDNWYFGNPVNQLGQTEYSTNWNQYTIDRWSTEGNVGDIKVVVSTSRVDVTNTHSQSAGHLVQFKQNLPAELCLPGKTYTLSVLTENVVGGVGCYLSQVGAPYQASFQGPIASGLSTYTGVMIDGQQRVGFILGHGATMSSIAVKLELGSQQTLAHQDADGNWILNEIPDCGEQLRRCQRYQFEAFDRILAGQGFLAQVKATDSTQAYGVLPTPVTMREGSFPALVTDCSAANPYNAFGIYSTGYSSGEGMITGISLFGRIQNGVILRAAGSNFVAGNDYQIWVENQNAHQLLLDLNL